LGQTQVVALPGLDTYSPEQWERARAVSRALAHYESLLKLPDIETLHARRHRAWMECVMAMYFGTASTKDICSWWSKAADDLLALAWREAGINEYDAVLFALGKHGAEELNLSSDIDVMLVAEPRHAIDVEKRLRIFQKRINVPGEFGFCFRLDFDLRPGGKFGPMITSPSQFQDYYWSQGETWERLALVRLRAVTGSRALDKQISDLARRFSYRKFLDFTLLEDLKALRSQVHQKGFQRRENEIHIKLEVGGIRDIELFVHSLLVMNGGKLPELQTRSTEEALHKLGEKNLMSKAEAEQLRDSYWHYRHLENMVQSLEDRQTHSLTDPALKTLALPDRPSIEMRMKHVDTVVSSLLGRVDLEAVHLPQDEGAQKQWLLDLGFSKDAVDSTWDQLIKATALSYKNDRDERARQEFLFAFVTELSQHKGLDRDMGLRLLVDFVKATRAKATFFSMLLRSPRLLQDLSRLFCLSPYLGSILSSRPELLDHFILRVDEAWAADMEPLLQQMSERKLLTELWAANQFLNERKLDGLFSRVTATADEISLQLLSQLKHDFPDSLVKIVALGKWGGEELGLRSDLDFVFVTPQAPKESDFKVARRFISRLTDPLKGGNLYEVDLRLRPSGQSGPLLIAEDSLAVYWKEQAKAWERQAYLRARPLGLHLDKSVLTARGLQTEELEELKRIRSKLLTTRKEKEFDVKYIPGGLIDIEFTAQTALLASKIAGAPPSTLGMIEHLSSRLPAWNTGAAGLSRIYSELRTFEQMLQLSATYKIGAVKRDHADFTKAANLMGLDAEEAWKKLNDWTQESCVLLAAVDPTGFERHQTKS
jgi:[glutamine synthetase] adenylyltransferase / [glutamine synthetase]-adenylyl-L-tyrosine phosphorylase